MKHTGKLKENSNIPRTAADWHSRLQTDDVSAQDRAAFELWLEADPAHRTEYEDCVRMWNLSQGLRSHPAALDALAELEAGSGYTQARPVRRFLKPALLAASVALVFMSAGLVFMRIQTPPTYETAVGEQESITLEDGSVVMLNTTTELAVRYTEQERQVELIDGEAFFEVVDSDERPFVVMAGRRHVRVVGTKFNVRREANDVSVAVVEGEVAVEPGGQAAEKTQAEAERVQLRPGQRIAYAAARLEEIETIDPQHVLAWREGRIYFDADPLAHVVAEVNRYTDTQFVLDDSALLELPLSGIFKTGDSESVVFALKENFGIETRRDGDRILLRSKANEQQDPS